jgi:hypothetical protein
MNNPESNNDGDGGQKKKEMDTNVEEDFTKKLRAIDTAILSVSDKSLISELLKRTEEGEVVVGNEIAVVAKDENRSTIEDPVHHTHTPSVKSEDIQSVRVNNFSKGLHTGKAKMMKNDYADAKQKCLLKIQSLERAIKM